MPIQSASGLIPRFKRLLYITKIAYFVYEVGGDDQNIRSSLSLTSDSWSSHPWSQHQKYFTFVRTVWTGERGIRYKTEKNLISDTYLGLRGNSEQTTQFCWLIEPFKTIRRSLGKPIDLNAYPFYNLYFLDRFVHQIHRDTFLWWILNLWM